MTVSLFILRNIDLGRALIIFVGYTCESDTVSVVLSYSSASPTPPPRTSYCGEV